MKLPVSYDTFITFLLNAKRHTYASQGDDATVPPLLLNSRQLEYQNGELFYRDIYFGMTRFAGQEVVYHRDIPIWTMSYNGGVVSPMAISVDTNQTYTFLRTAMSLVGPHNPYRGPKDFQEGGFTYKDENQGGLESFFGKETIHYHGYEVYQLHYIGGIIQ